MFEWVKNKINKKKDDCLEFEGCVNAKAEWDNITKVQRQQQVRRYEEVGRGLLEIHRHGVDGWSKKWKNKKAFKYNKDNRDQVIINDVKIIPYIDLIKQIEKKEDREFAEKVYEVISYQKYSALKIIEDYILDYYDNYATYRNKETAEVLEDLKNILNANPDTKYAVSLIEQSKELKVILTNFESVRDVFDTMNRDEIKRFLVENEVSSRFFDYKQNLVYRNLINVVNYEVNKKRENEKKENLKREHELFDIYKNDVVRMIWEYERNHRNTFMNFTDADVNDIFNKNYLDYLEYLKKIKEDFEEEWEKKILGWKRSGLNLSFININVVKIREWQRLENSTEIAVRAKIKENANAPESIKNRLSADVSSIDFDDAMYLLEKMPFENWYMFNDTLDEISAKTI